jgi:Sec-independent protein secretion pathway component TatC
MAEPRPQHQHGDDDLSDMLQEMRVLQQGAQVLTAFLVILPFTETFGELTETQTWVFLATFLTSLASLVFLSAPAATHRLTRPIRNREKFKNSATRTILVGVVFQSISWVLVTDLVVSAVFDGFIDKIAAALMAGLVLAMWWVVPFLRRNRF